MWTSTVPDVSLDFQPLPNRWEPPNVVVCSVPIMNLVCDFRNPFVSVGRQLIQAQSVDAALKIVTLFPVQYTKMCGILLYDLFVSGLQYVIILLGDDRLFGHLVLLFPDIWRARRFSE